METYNYTKKLILCFGDSNTFGFIPENGHRYKDNERWSGIFKNLVKEKYEVIEAGCNNRTAFSDNQDGDIQTGYKILPKYLFIPFDYIILQLGINDTQFQYNNSFESIYTGIEKLVKIIKTLNPKAKIIILSPSIIRENILHSFFSQFFNKQSIKLSQGLQTIFCDVALKNDCILIDLNSLVLPSDIDGIHYSKYSHRIIANELYKIVN